MAVTSGATQLHNAITGLFNAIRSKASISGNMTFAKATSAVNSINTGGGSIVEQIIRRTLSTIPQEEANKITSIGSYAFCDCSALKTASFPKITSTGYAAFKSCTTLTTVSFPSVTTINDYAFQYCSALTTVSFPKVTAVGANAFYGCSALSTVSFSKITTIENHAFAYCSALTTVSFPSVTTIKDYAFRSCAALTTARFSSVSNIWGSAFISCRSLISLYLTRNSVAKLSNSNAFNYTPLSAGGSGKIYVPSNLLANYQRASNWSLIKSRIVSM